MSCRENRIACGNEPENGIDTPWYLSALIENPASPFGIRWYGEGSWWPTQTPFCYVVFGTIGGKVDDIGSGSQGGLYGGGIDGANRMWYRR